jgi:hypothetical protein
LHNLQGVIVNDFVLAPDETGERLVAHRVDCPEVRAQADAGVFVMTLLGCEKPLPRDVRRHWCLSAD